MGQKNSRKPRLLLQYLMARGFLLGQFFFHASKLALESYSIMPFLTKTIGGRFFFFLFNYCFISPLIYVQCFEFPLENSRSELGYSEIYILLLALVVVSRAAYGKLWFVTAVRQKSNERHLIERIHIH